MSGMYCSARRIVPVIALAILVLAGSPQRNYAQPAGIDPQAEKLLRRMSDYLASRQQFTFEGGEHARSRADIRAEDPV